MSVVPMQKVRVIVHQSDVDGLLTIVQRAGAIEFNESKLTDLSEAIFHSPHAQLFPRVQHALTFLKPYAPKRSLWRTLRDGSHTELTETDLLRQMKDTDAVSAIVIDMEALQVEFAEVNEQVRSLSEQHTLLAQWKSLPLKLENLQTKTTATKLLTTTDTKRSLTDSVSEAFAAVGIEVEVTTVNQSRVAITVFKSTPESELAQAIEQAGATVSVVPKGSETPDVEFASVSEKLAAAKGTLGLLHDQAEHFAITHFRSLEVASEILEWERDRFATATAGSATKQTVVLDGWLNQMKRAEIESQIAQENIAAVLYELPLEEGEQPPVDIVNSSFIQPFEAVTRLYGMPGYKDLDPTVFLAAFFFLFFGLSLTDVGYGLALVVAAVFILTMTKVTKSTRSFAKLLLYIGIATVFVGMLFGGYLGFDPSLLPAPLQALQAFDPIGDPLPVFYLALGLGVLQVMVGMVLKIYSESRNGRLVSGLLDEGPWLFEFMVGILFILTSVGYVDILSIAQIGNLAIVGAVLIFLSSGRHGDTLLAKGISSMAGLYAGVGHFSDILSYSRLLALGLATSALAYAVNLIASMVAGVPYVGLLLAFVILLIGHLFTLAINTLGAFVHSARLQFVEFFGKFITGTGKEFAPLSRTEKYITVGDD